MTHDEHNDHERPVDQPDEQPQDKQGDDFGFEIEPLDIQPYKPSIEEPVTVPMEDSGPETYVPDIPLPPVVDEVPAAPVDAVEPQADRVPSVPRSETFVGEIVGVPPAGDEPVEDVAEVVAPAPLLHFDAAAQQVLDDDAGPEVAPGLPLSPSGTAFSPPPPLPPPPPPIPSLDDDEFAFLLAPVEPKEKRKRKRKDDPDYDPRDARSFTWLEAWTQAVTQPRPETYEELAADPDATVGRASTWIAITYLVFGIMAMCGLMLFILPSGDAGAVLGALFCLMPFFVVFAVVAGVIMLMVYFGVMHLIARILGGKGSFDDLFYAGTCYYLPLMIISSIVGVIPCFGTVIQLGVWAYALWLGVIAIKAIHEIEWGRAAVAGLVWVGVGCGCICAFVCLLVAVPDVAEGLFTPTPTPTGVLWNVLRGMLGV